MPTAAYCLSHLTRPQFGNWREHLGYFDAINPAYLDTVIEAILREGPMYKSELEGRLCTLVPSARRDQIRWLLDFKFGCTRRAMLYPRRKA